MWADGKSKFWPGVLGLLGVTLLAYLPALQAGYIWDDDDYVTHNLTLRSLHGLYRIWFELGAVPQYYPVTHTTFWLEYQLWGLWPVGYHLTNVLLHALGAVLAWQVLQRLHLPGSWFAGLLFAVHPVHVESVVWVTERKNVLSGVCYLAAAYCLTRFFTWEIEGELSICSASPSLSARDRDLRWYVLAAGLFLCGLLAKSVVATLPAACLLVLWWQTNRWRWTWVVWMLPLFMLGYWLGTNTASMEKWRVGAIGPEFEWSWGERCLVAGRAIWFYVGKLLVPYPLSFSYGRWPIDTGDWRAWLWPLSAVALVVVLWCLRQRCGRGPLVAALYFGGTLFPALGFVNVFPMRYAYVADHFQYLASLGPLALAAAGGAMWLPTLVRWAPVRTGLGLVWCVVLAGLTFQQACAYRDAETLWRDTLVKSPRAWLALGNLGRILFDRGEVTAATELFERAYAEAPLAPETSMNLSAAWIAAGRYAEARALLDRALERHPRFAPLSHHLGLVEEAAGRLDAAWLAYRRAWELQPESAIYQAAYGKGLVLSGDLTQGKPLLERALQQNPQSFEARMSLGMAFAIEQDLDRAAAEFQHAVELRPEDAEAWANLGRAQLLAGQPVAGVAHLRRALDLNPDLHAARAQLALTLAAHRDPQVRNGHDALQQARELHSRSTPRDPVALDVLAASYAELGEFETAVELVTQAITICQELGDEQFAAVLRERQMLYADRRPYRE